METATEEGVWLAEPQPPCPITPGGSVTKQGIWQLQEKATFLIEALHRQQVWCQWVTWFVLFRFDFVQIHILVERTKAVLQCGLSARISLQCVCVSSSLGGHRNQGPDSPGIHDVSIIPLLSNGVFRAMTPKVRIFDWCWGDWKTHWHALSLSWMEASRTLSDSERSPWYDGAYAKLQPFWC